MKLRLALLATAVGVMGTASTAAGQSPPAPGKGQVLATGTNGQTTWLVTHVPDPSGQHGYCVFFNGVGTGTNASLGGGESCTYADWPHICCTGNYGGIGSSDDGSGAYGYVWFVPADAVRIAMTIKSGRVLRARTHAIPRRFGMRVAWIVLDVPYTMINSLRLEVRRVVTYDRAGRVAGTWGPR